MVVLFSRKDAKDFECVSLRLCAFAGDQNRFLQVLHSLRRRALRVPHAEQRMYIVRENQLVMNALTPSITIRTAAFSKKSLTVFYSSRMMSLPAFIPGLKRPVKHRPGVSGSQLILDVGIRLTATRWM